jgi:small subunit ribosomal protein SAe
MASSALPAALNATEEDIQQLLAAQCHIGSKNCDKAMEPYVFKRRADGELVLPFLSLSLSLSFSLSILPTFLTWIRLFL